MNNLLLSLEITALGMGLVFGAIILLWGMMAILTAVTAEKEAQADEGTSTSLSDPASDSPDVASPPQADSKLQVALLAVAMALAEQGQTSARPLEQPPTALVSAWQLGMRTRQMSEKGNQPRLRKS
ncbi:MAG TPA: OadG family protein [Anaerolineales bacterium]|nr:OadG family protein [Anaerolineales bacterium]